ncbi:MAG TPA: DUF47 family protein [Thermomicrobiales bacterium]|nr:DUF47 family protein [Thermomicrobiales bacterium]
MVLSRFLPKDEQFFDFFREAAENASESARLLASILAIDGDESARNVRRLRDLEHRGDEISHRIFSALNSTFVTPLDRDDIRELATTIDDFVDGIEECGKRFSLYRLEVATPMAQQFAQILVEQGVAILAAVPLLAQAAKHAQDLRRWVLELHRLENEADDLLNNALASLYDGVDDVPGLIHAHRWGELYQMLEDATDCGEDVADVLEGILITYA